MEITIDALMGRGCKCCDNLKPKLEKIAQERGYNLEFTDVGDISDLPNDLTGVPYIIISMDGIFVDNFQGDMAEELIQAKIDSSLGTYKRLMHEKEK